MKKEYRQLSTWIEKASYLEGILTPRLEHRELKVINIIHFFIYRFFILNIKRNYESREKCFISLNISPICFLSFSSRKVIPIKSLKAN